MNVSSICHQKGAVLLRIDPTPYQNTVNSLQAKLQADESLVETAQKRNLPLKIIKFESKTQAQQSPSPATIFSLYLNGKFVTTDISACMDSRFDKIVRK